jgi:Holliday junction resolvase RusA-like endonuclease
MQHPLVINVRGMPHPQGSMKTHALPNGKVAVRYPAAVYQWRAQIQQAVAEVMQQLTDAYDVPLPIEGAVELRLGFDLPRPMGHFGTGKNAASIKASSPLYPIVAPDTDKLIRAVCDAITDAGLWRDDSQVTTLLASKRYCINGSPPGVLIKVLELN